MTEEPKITAEDAVRSLVLHGARHSLSAVIGTLQRVVARQSVQGRDVDPAARGMLEALVANREKFLADITEKATAELDEGKEG